MGSMRTLFGLVFLLAVGRAGSAAATETLLLKDQWQLQTGEKVYEAGRDAGAPSKEAGEAIAVPGYQAAGWYPITLPTTVLAALVENEVYPDPFYGDNITKIPGYKAGRWLVMPPDSPFRSPWWYRTVFKLPTEFAGKNLTLHLDGINYQANIWLNGKKIADSAQVIGMFRRFEFPINDVALHGKDNCLAVEIIPPGLIEDKPYRTKQIEATTGWDDHNPQPPDLNMGIWRDVYVTATGPVALRNPYVATDLDLPSLEVAHLTVSADVRNVTNEAVTAVVTGTIENITFSKEIKLAPKETRIAKFAPQEFAQLTIAKPRLWWPHPVGPQELYNLDLRVYAAGRDAGAPSSVKDAASDTLRVRFGIREATTYLNEEGWRGYRVNGKNVLIRGGAWMTCDMLLRLTPKRYDALVRYAREANLNMLRSEGFSIRETEEFYDLCDQYGVMVTQQIFGRSIPDEDLAIQCIEDMMLRIRNHPSLVHFLGHDETFPTERLDQAYKDLIAKYTPERTYQPHSGAFDVKERFETGGTRTGTRELWTYAIPNHYYTHKEDGAWGFAQSGGIGGTISPIESMRKMMPEEALWPPFTPAWSLHTVIQGARYFDAMLQGMNTRYGESKNIEEFCTKGQAMNYDSARGLFEAYARNKYAATGITPWKYNAAWPASPTWQYVDWYLQATGAYYGAKKACEALHAQYSYDDHSICVVNSLYQEFKQLTVTAKVLNFDMTEKWSKTATVDVTADGKTNVFTVEWPEGLSKVHFLSLTLRDNAGKEVSNNLYWLSTVPDVPGAQSEIDWIAFKLEPKSTADFTDLGALPRVKLDVTSRTEEHGGERVVRVKVANPGKNLAFQVHLAVTKGAGGPEVTPTFWSDNYLSLLPGETREVTATVYTEDLGGAAPVVNVGGWNME